MQYVTTLLKTESVLLLVIAVFIACLLKVSLEVLHTTASIAV